jgi:hypothetical protein
MISFHGQDLPAGTVFQRCEPQIATFDFARVHFRVFVDPRCVVLYGPKSPTFPEGSRSEAAGKFREIAPAEMKCLSLIDGVIKVVAINVDVNDIALGPTAKHKSIIDDSAQTKGSYR